MKKEPQIHSHITDILPDDHPLAFDGVFCIRCQRILHAANNECMSTWVETGMGNFCIWCFALLACFEQDVGRLHNEIGSALEDGWGLPND